MKFYSTRGGEQVSAAQAIVQGLCPNGGLYVPSVFPQIDISALSTDYLKTAALVMGSYLDIPKDRLEPMIASAYASFDTREVTPVHALTDHESILELWHGPTMAFKDVALQMLPYLMRESVLMTGEDRQVYILVATSGDTGKAALAGFQDVPGTRILVFYPHGGVSKAQRLQMVTQEGANVDVCAVRGNFDDAQTGVKAIFGSRDCREKLDSLGYRLSSANSINFGRLLPQITYYFHSYATLVSRGSIQCGDPVNFCVPTGNFGDILAGYYAMRMGLPVGRLICASNRNNVLTDFFQTGTYDDRRPFYKSMSCSIDILISSNLERYVYELCGRNEATVRERMSSLRENGSYSVSVDELASMGKTFSAGWCSEEDTLATIRRIYDREGYLMDPHTAVAQTVHENYVAGTGDKTHTVLLSTANPYKFSTDVLSAFVKAGPDDFENAARLHEMSGMPVPDGFSQLLSKPERHLDVCDIADMPMRVIGPVSK